MITIKLTEKELKELVDAIEEHLESMLGGYEDNAQEPGYKSLEKLKERLRLAGNYFR